MESKRELVWRNKQMPGKIMKPQTFIAIKKEAIKRYGPSNERANKVVGHAYWATVESKFKHRGGR